MMNTYCLKCKKPTKDLNSKGFVTTNKKYKVKSTCAICKSKKSKFVSKKMLLAFLVNYFQKYLF